MGNGADFFARDAEGRQSEYESLSPAVTINGIKGHLIKRKGDSDTHTNLPFYANSSDVYFRQNVKGVCQARTYMGHNLHLDLDWSHAHTNKGDGRHFPAGVVHVQIWEKQKDGTFKRLSNEARFMNNHEMKRFGPILKYFCPSVKFR